MIKQQSNKFHKILDSIWINKFGTVNFKSIITNPLITLF